MRLLLPLLLLLAACGQGGITLPPCFPFCDGGGGGGPRHPPGGEVRALEVVLLRETVEAIPGTSGTFLSLPLRVRLEGDPGTYWVWLNALVQTPEGRVQVGQRTLEMGAGEERETELSLWVGPGWPPGDHLAHLEATASGYPGRPISRPFTLQVR
ncbi:hypothetical protein [Thermus sp.]|uniref:hypothetical protein n=1 Tax=Thermus sp. TaxID=275 RepID=UPI00298F0A0A|nr:hypothetical protein [Thermus sp.]MDW8358605.1 hypothetical protein [Thermus sp.]